MISLFIHTIALLLVILKQFNSINQLDENTLSLNVLSKSLLNTGQLKVGILSPDTLKIQCLRIVVFGGSITRGCGRMQYHEDAPGDDPKSLDFGCNFENSFGAKLAIELNQKYPCVDPSTGNQHIVNRIMQARAPIDNLVENLIRYKIDSDSDSLLMRECNLFIIETSVNDALDVFSDIDGVSLEHIPHGNIQQRWGDEDSQSNIETTLKGFYELTIGILKSFPNKPDLLFLGSSLNLNRPTLSTQSTIYVQQEVARYYNIPVISAIDMFGSANHTDIMSPTVLEWFKLGGWMIGHGDCCHIRKTSNRILAKAILYGLEVASTLASCSARSTSHLNYHYLYRQKSTARMSIRYLFSYEQAMMTEINCAVWIACILLQSKNLHQRHIRLPAWSLSVRMESGDSSRQHQGLRLSIE